MLETIMKYDILFYAMIIAMAVGVIAKMISHYAIKKLVKSASEVQKSNHRLMRLLKAKFEHASMVSDRVQNVEAFVQKYMYEYKVFLVSLHTWRGLPLSMAWTIAILGILAGMGCYRFQLSGEEIYKYVSMAMVFVVVLLGLFVLSDEKRKLVAVKNYVVEYLENVCVHRYEKASQAVREEEQETKEEIPVVTAEEETVEETDNVKRREEQEMRIRAILEEFLA